MASVTYFSLIAFGAGGNPASRGATAIHCQASFRSDPTIDTFNKWGPQSMSEAFHCSFNPSINLFHAFSHFGSREAALQTLDRKQDEGKSGILCLYKVEILVPSSSLLRVNDWGTPGPIGLAMMLRDGARSERRACFEAFRSELVSRKRHGLDFKEYGWSWVRAHLRSMQKRGLAYPNIVEGASDADSWCITDPQDVRIVSRRLVLPGEISRASLTRRVRIARIGSAVRSSTKMAET